MKYTIETTEYGCVEILELRNDSKYIKRHVKTSYGSQCKDNDFADQMEADGICEEIREKVYDVFDGMFPSDFMDMDKLDLN